MPQRSFDDGVVMGLSSSQGASRGVYGRRQGDAEGPKSETLRAGLAGPASMG
jgi:hypothetical protein